MTLTSRLRSLGPKTRVAMAVAVMVAVGIALFDWNWIRPALERHLAERSQREVVISDLHISFDLTLQPTVRLRGVRIANAAWADTTRPMAVAGEASFTFTWRSLLERRPVVTRLVLTDADIDLQRLADGSRNWRLRRPQDRGPGRFKFMTLEAHRSKVRFLHRGIDLDLQTAARPLASPQHIEAGEEALVTQIDFSGTWRGAAFKGEAEAPLVLPLLDTGRSFPLRGQVSSGATLAVVEGTVTDLFRLTAVDAAVQLSGASLAGLHPFVPVSLPATRPYKLQARVKKDQGDYQVSEVNAKIGESDLSGDISYHLDDDRPLLQATLQSQHADPADLGVPARPEPTAGHPSPDQAATGPKRLFSTRDLPSGKLRQFDAELQLQVKNLRLPGLPALQALRLTARLNDGLLSVKPVQFNLAAGQASGSLTVDGRKDPPGAELEFNARQLRVDKLLPDLPAASRVTGPVNLQLKLGGQGHTVATLMAHASGSLAAQMKDGSIADVLDAKLGLNGGKLLRASLGEPKQIPIDCAALSLAIQHGIGTTRALVLETAQTQLQGTGRVDLREETFWLLLDPRPKKLALLALPQSIRVDGSFTEARLSLAKPLDRPADAGCAGASRTR